jgi:hypothetical protein
MQAGQTIINILSEDLKIRIEGEKIYSYDETACCTGTSNAHRQAGQVKATMTLFTTVTYQKWSSSVSLLQVVDYKSHPSPPLKYNE